MVLRKELLREFISAINLKSAKDIQSALKEVFSGTLQEMLKRSLMII